MTQMAGNEALMEVFHREGVEYVFGIPGATEVLFMDAIESHREFKYILGLHEVVAAGMAEGYARTSGKVGVLNLHTGPGLAAATPMLSNAYYGGVPLVVTAGQQDTRLWLQEPALMDNLVRIAGPFSKWATEIIHAEDIPMVMHRAFKVAAHPPTGPVFVSLPQNILAQYADFEYVKGAQSFTKLRPDPEPIKVAVDLLSKAVNPVVIVEDGITRNNALDEVVEFAELIGARVYQPWMADVNFPVHHPLYMGDLDLTSLSTREMLATVDVLIVIGALFFSQPIYLSKPLVPPSTRVIQIDNNPWQIAKNFPVASGIEGDIKVAVAELTAALKKHCSNQATETVKNRIEAISQETQNSRQAFYKRAQKEKDQVPIAVTRLMTEIRDAMRPGTRIVDDCWSCSAILRQTIPFSEPASFMRARGGGSIGWGMSGALGVKLASPDRPVVAIVGDGSAMWSIQSLWTASHYDIPVTYIICVNTCYNQVRRVKHLVMGEMAKGRYLGTDLCNPQNDFCKIAEGMGVTAQRVEKPEQLKEALNSAFNLDKPNLVEVYIESRL